MADITFTGNLGGDAELRYTAGGEAVLNFSVADELRRKDGNEWKTVSTTWWRTAIWGKPAEALAEVLKKGTKVVVAGQVHERKYEHQGVEKTAYDVKARTVGVIPRGEPSGRPGGQSSAPASDPWATAGPAAPAGGSSFADEPPF